MTNYKQNITKIQHYIPQLILRKWKNLDNTWTIFEVDTKQVVILNSLNNLYSNDYFYEVDLNNPNNIVEKLLSTLEQNYSENIDKLIKQWNQKNIFLTYKNLEIINFFHAIQTFRTNAYRQMMLLKDNIEIPNITDDTFFKVKVNGLTEMEVKKQQLTFLEEYLKLFLYNKKEFSKKILATKNKYLKYKLNDKPWYKVSDYDYKKIEFYSSWDFLLFQRIDLVYPVLIEASTNNYFILPDLNEVSIATNEGDTICDFVPITPKHAIAYVYKNIHEKISINNLIQNNDFSNFLKQLYKIDFKQKDNSNFNFQKIILDEDDMNLINNFLLANSNESALFINQDDSKNLIPLIYNFAKDFQKNKKKLIIQNLENQQFQTNLYNILLKQKKYYERINWDKNMQKINRKNNKKKKRK